MDAHQRARRRLLAELHDGDPCARCGLPMHRTQELDADHRTYPAALNPGALPDALSHASCNRRHGAHLGQLLRGQLSRGKPVAPRATPLHTSRDW